MGKKDLYQRALVKAYQQLGSMAELCKYLRVSPQLVSRWLSAEEGMPEVAFLRLVDLVLDDMDGEDERYVADLRAEAAKAKEATKPK